MNKKLEDKKKDLEKLLQEVKDEEYRLQHEKEVAEATKKLREVILPYFDYFDDFYEAKDELIKDINKVLKASKRDEDGVMCRTKYNGAIYKFNEALKKDNF